MNGQIHELSYADLDDVSGGMRCLCHRRGRCPRTRPSHRHQSLSRSRSFPDPRSVLCSPWHFRALTIGKAKERLDIIWVARTEKAKLCDLSLEEMEQVGGATKSLQQILREYQLILYASRFTMAKGPLH